MAQGHGRGGLDGLPGLAVLAGRIAGAQDLVALGQGLQRLLQRQRIQRPLERQRSHHVVGGAGGLQPPGEPDRKSTRLKLQSQSNLVCRLLLEKKKKKQQTYDYRWIDSTCSRAIAASD